MGLILLVVWGIWLLVDNVVWLIPLSVERELGQLVKPVYEELALPSSQQDILNRLLDELEANLPTENREGRDYQILYVPENTGNALALPGDAIVVYAGLVEVVQSENELMMILGHELGHFAHRDPLRNIGRGLLLQAAIATFVGDAGWWQNAIASILYNISHAQYSQTQERQADEFGLMLLQSHYGHVGGATDFFDRLANPQRRDFAFLSTHPTPHDRAQRLTQLIQQQGYPIQETTPLPQTLRSVRSEWVSEG